jgi:hypothetical protein
VFDAVFGHGRPFHFRLAIIDYRLNSHGVLSGSSRCAVVVFEIDN